MTRTHHRPPAAPTRRRHAIASAIIVVLKATCATWAGLGALFALLLQALELSQRLGAL